MNLATVVVLIILLALYGLAIRSVCRQGACADCGARAVCPAHQLRAHGLKKPDAAALAYARRLSEQDGVSKLIITVRKSDQRL